MNMEGISYQDIAKALEICAREDSCDGCPLDKLDSQGRCIMELRLMAAESIRTLWELLGQVEDEQNQMQKENGILSLILEKYGQQEIGKLTRLAEEANTALERGLNGVNDDLYSQMQEHQAQLAAMGVGCEIHATPVGEKGWHIDHMKVDSVTVFGNAEGCG